MQRLIHRSCQSRFSYINTSNAREKPAGVNRRAQPLAFGHWAIIRKLARITIAFCYHRRGGADSFLAFALSRLKLNP
jgi:hypothetical protein